VRDGELVNEVHKTWHERHMPPMMGFKVALVSPREVSAIIKSSRVEKAMPSA